MNHVFVVFAILLVSLVVTELASAQVLRDTLQTTANGHAKVDKWLASTFAGECAAVPKKTEADAAALEKKYFPLAAKKLLGVDHCENIALRKLIQEGYDGHFVRKVTRDIAVKLPTLRRLSNKVAALTHELDELNKENDDYDRQIARIGYIADYQIAQRRELGKKLAKTAADLKVPTEEFKTLLGSIWRASDTAVQKYLSAMIASRLSPTEYLRESRRPQPSWASRTVFGNPSFLDAVIRPMIANAEKLDKTLLSQFSKDKVFYPTFSTRKLLTDNMDLLYNPETPSPEFKNLACRLDQEYSKGDDDLGTIISVGTLFVGPAGKIVPWAMRAVKLGHLVEGRTFLTMTLSAMDKITAGSMLVQTAQAAYDACNSSFDHIHNARNVCREDVTIEQIDNYESRQLDRDNCPAWVAAAALTEGTVGRTVKGVESIFGSDPNLMLYLEKAKTGAVTAMRYKDGGMSVKYNSESGKDFFDMIANTKDPDDDKSSK